MGFWLACLLTLTLSNGYSFLRIWIFLRPCFKLEINVDLLTYSFLVTYGNTHMHMHIQTHAHIQIRVSAHVLHFNLFFPSLSGIS